MGAFSSVLMLKDRPDVSGSPTGTDLVAMPHVGTRSLRAGFVQAREAAIGVCLSKACSADSLKCQDSDAVLGTTNLSIPRRVPLTQG